jgi:hypothetical protein
MLAADEMGAIDMFRIGTGIAATVLSLSMIAASISEASAQGNQRKAAPAAARPAPAARAAPVARPSQGNPPIGAALRAELTGLVLALVQATCFAPVQRTVR